MHPSSFGCSVKLALRGLPVFFCLPPVPVPGFVVSVAGPHLGRSRFVVYFARRARRSESQIHTVLTSRRIQPRCAKSASADSAGMSRMA